MSRASIESPGVSFSDADERRVDVALAKRDGERSAERFLPFPKKDAADDFPTTVETRQFLLGNPGKKHPTEGAQVALTPPVVFWLSERDITGLQHCARIGSAPERAQWISSRTRRCV